MIGVLRVKIGNIKAFQAPDEKFFDIDVIWNVRAYYNSLHAG